MINTRLDAKECGITSPQDKDKRNYVMGAYFARQLRKGHVRQECVKDVKIVLSCRDRSSRGNNNTNGRSTVIGNTENHVEDVLNAFETVGGNNDNTIGDRNPLVPTKKSSDCLGVQPIPLWHMFFEKKQKDQQWEDYRCPAARTKTTIIQTRSFSSLMYYRRHRHQGSLQTRPIP